VRDSTARVRDPVARLREPTSRFREPISRFGAGARLATVSDTLPPFQRFLDSHRDAVWRFLVSSVGASEAEDCFQETFIAALRAYPRLRADSNVRAWVLTIAHRKALDAHRARARRALPVEDALTLDERRAASPQPADETLWSAVEELPARQRSAVVLRYVADLPHRDIAAALSCSEEAARRSLHEGLVKLREAVSA
jgi:RNA polymerase sigma factor (sigma-70 family)